MMKIGLVGCGRWGKLILRDLKLLGAIVTVYAPSSDSVENALTFNADRIVRSFDDLLNFECDGYIIASPTLYHAKNMYDLLGKGKPIFTEKPLCCRAEDADLLSEVGRDLIFVMDKWKYHNGINKIAEISQKMPYGNPKKIILKRLQWSSPHTDVDASWILVPHDIAIIQKIFGCTPEVKSVLSHSNAGESIDSIHAFMKVGDVDVVLEVSSQSVLTERSILVVFDKASVLLCDSVGDHLLVHHVKNHFGDKPEKIFFESNMPLQDEIKHFLQYLDGERIELQSPVMEAADSVRLICKLREMSLKV
ncbi:hypothetical protein C4K68_01020 [Pokkaliibacter plantistimulans]|uniref:Gfo/Idh/MocA-like oxidoreductase N-terminal domain-containing protein n=1 Tax=Proteobacteria bacterium 228 TaxID=2083153 RepID=A0A2S5KWT7_9PROT|nr:Gfo/Idh/MocA family oxidoreductase [Pokkaliibacter plantistimulans]PPC79317.1 hypothetical protein C4K68_01020 [Pokkaliibacter plantistimulans]